MNITIAIRIRKWGVNLIDIEGTFQLHLKPSFVLKRILKKKLLEALEASTFQVSGQVAIDEKLFEIEKGQVVLQERAV